MAKRKIKIKPVAAPSSSPIQSTRDAMTESSSLPPYDALPPDENMPGPFSPIPDHDTDRRVSTRDAAGLPYDSPLDDETEEAFTSVLENRLHDLAQEH